MADDDLLARADVAIAAARRLRADTRKWRREVEFTAGQFLAIDAALEAELRRSRAKTGAAQGKARPVARAGEWL